MISFPLFFHLVTLSSITRVNGNSFFLRKPKCPALSKESYSLSFGHFGFLPVNDLERVFALLSLYETNFMWNEKEVRGST